MIHTIHRTIHIYGRMYMYILLFVVGIVGSAYLLLGCTQYGIQLYTVTADQFAAMRAIAGIPACPVGKTNIAGVVELPGGGGQITVKCGLVE